MGSKGTGSLAHMATSSTRRASAPSQPSGPLVMPVACTCSRASSMRFSVMVPVLSVHTTAADPSVSTVEALLTITPCFASRHAPSARKVAKVASKPAACWMFCCR